MIKENPIKDVAEITRKLTIAGVAGWVFFFAIWGVAVLVVIELLIVPSTYLFRFCPLILELAGAIGIGLGLWDFIRMKQTHISRLRRKIANFIVITIGFLIFFFGFFAQRFLVAGYAFICGENMSGISKSLLLYSNDNNGQYPSVQKWCDLLIVKEDVAPGQFRCPGPWTGRCHYAINPNCEPNSPADTVLLFETKSGWNQHGGPELLTFDNHAGKGAFVVFNDGHMRFIEPNEVGKLKWKAEAMK